MKINLQAPINSLGYGYTGANFLYELAKTNEVNLFEIGPIENLGKLSDKAVQLSFSQNGYIIDNKAISLKIWHQNDLHSRVGTGRHIGFPIFELNKFNSVEVNSMNSCDMIFTCSKWAKEIVNYSTKVPTKVVPLGYDPEIFKYVNKILPGPTVFFNCGKWEKRKGHDVILECFEKAFSYSDNVELWMMCHNPFPHGRGSDWEYQYKISHLANKIRLIPRQSTHKNVYNIMSRVDCGVFPARAEGWNLELLELMACGKHLIATNYSGHTEFCKNGINLIEIQQLEPAIDNIWFHGNGEWAYIGKDQKDFIIEKMRQIHNDKNNNNLEPNKNAAISAQEYTWEKSTRKLIEALK